jgi:hypothetical protein
MYAVMDKFANVCLYAQLTTLACFLRLILVASNTIKTIDIIKLHYLLFELHSTGPKFDV